MAGARILVAAAAAVAATTTGLAAPPASFDFTVFETQLLPRWLSLFRLSPAPGNFSYDRTHRVPSLYAAADVVQLLWRVGQLNISAAEADAWAGMINAWQNSSGFFVPEPYEYSAGFEPWHACGFATAALELLGRAPAHPPQWAVDIAAAGQAAWEATFVPLLNDTTPAPKPCATGGPQPCNVWSRGHKIAAVPAVLHMAGLDAQPDVAAFLDWWKGPFVNTYASPENGYWCLVPSWGPPSIICLGGAFHIEFVLTALGVGVPLPGAMFNASLGLQHASGLWGGGPPQFIDLDGVYSVIRPAAQMGKPPTEWAAAHASCVAFLAAAEAALNNASVVLGPVYGATTHTLVGAVTGVAECAKWWPELVTTVRPWRQGLDVAPFV